MKGVWLGIRGIFQRNNPQATLARKPYKDNIDIYFVSMCRYNTWYTRTNVYAFNIHTIKNNIDICTYMSVIYIHILEERKAYKKTWCVSPFDVWSQSSWCQNSRREHGWHPRSPFSISHVWVANDCLNVSWWSRGRRILLCQPIPPRLFSIVILIVWDIQRCHFWQVVNRGKAGSPVQMVNFVNHGSYPFRWPEALGCRTRGAYNFSQSHNDRIFKFQNDVLSHQVRIESSRDLFRVQPWILEASLK